jgi:hypothetical protein
MGKDILTSSSFMLKKLVRHHPSRTTVRVSAIMIPDISSVLLINPAFNSSEFVGNLTTVSHLFVISIVWEIR